MIDKLGELRERIRLQDSHNKAVLRGKRRGAWYPTEEGAPMGFEVIATDGEAVQASVQYELGEWRSSGPQSYLWSVPTHWMLLPNPPRDNDRRP